MRVLIVACVLLGLSAPAFAGERVTDAALGAVAGAVVAGPVGLVAGGVVGYTAGPGIAREWGLKSHKRPVRSVPRTAQNR